MKFVKIRKNLIFTVSFIIAFFISITITYDSYSATKEYFLGDVNVDNEITLSDELLLLRHIYSVKSENNDEWQLTGDAIINADINEDKIVDISDVLCIKRYLLSQKDTTVSEKHSDWKNLCKKIKNESTSIVLNKTFLKIDLSELTTERLIATTDDSENLKWSSSNTNVATVSDEGVVTGKANGETIITVKNESGEYANCNVVVQTSPTEITLNITEQTLDMSLNKTFTLVPTIIPLTANVNREIKVKTSDSNVATISAKGEVTGKANGSAVITFYTANGKKANCNVKVQTSPTDIVLDNTHLNIVSNTPSTKKLMATIVPEDSNVYTELTWRSSNSNIATVSNNGEVTGKANGTAIITVETKNGKKATCNVDVKIEPKDPIAITLNKTSLTIDLSDSKTERLVATTNSSESLNWSSSNIDVATVSSDGLITGKANGKTTITVRESSGIEASCDVIVQTSPTGILLNATEQTLDLSETKTFILVPTVTPSTANVNNTIFFESNNPSIANISNNGEITGVSNGTTTVVVKTGNGKEAKCNIIVQTSPTGVILNATEQVLDLSGNKTFNIIPSIVPSTANVKTSLFAKSDNTDIAKISEQGTVTGISNGNTIITIETENGKKATCSVVVQTSPTGIYFQENKDDDKTQYITVNKGTSRKVNAIIEPSTANVNTDITYNIVSGNSRVANINPTTGEITGNQAGVVTIQASTLNGKNKTINLNVRIGNDVFDTTKLKANASENLLYSRNVDFSQNNTIGKKSHLQAFAVANSGIYYCSYHGKIMNISIGNPNETPYKCMILNNFGHGSGFELEKGAGGGKIWVDAVAQSVITRIQWSNKSEYYFASGTVNLKDTSKKTLKTYQNSKGENFVFTTNGEVKNQLRVAIDGINRLMAIRKGKYYYVFDLDEALAITDKTYELSCNTEEYGDCIVEFQAKDLHDIKPLTSFTMPTPKSESDVTWYAWQGFDLDGDYIYIGEGHYTKKVTPTLTTGKAFVSVFDYMYAYNGKKLAKEKIEVAAVNEELSSSKKLLAIMGDNGEGKYNLAQLEGIRVTTQGGVREMYLGFDSTFESTGKRSANILKYTY